MKENKLRNFKPGQFAFLPHSDLPMLVKLGPMRNYGKDKAGTEKRWYVVENTVMGGEFVVHASKLEPANI